MKTKSVKTDCSQVHSEFSREMGRLKAEDQLNVKSLATHVETFEHY